MVLFNKRVEEKEEHIEKNAHCVANPQEKHEDIENNLEKKY